MKTLKQIASEQRIEAAKKEKEKRRSRFVFKLARRKNINVDLMPCQLGHTQLVSEVVPAAGGYFYKSRACAGCPEGASFLGGKKNGLKQLEEGEVKGCFLVEEKFLFTDKEIEPGDRVVADLI